MFPTIPVFLDAMLDHPKNKVFVHCIMGISRSSTAVIAILVNLKEFGTIGEAFDYVKIRYKPKQGVPISVKR